ncbi:hypothetical protein AYO20_09171 [Fonsecaea nubica]|uniref:Uncharacterized protein n=1 Tax=Fonsecaea nubica TaxID=856822 RepID=A0A178CJC2_9EURO|nr:hypothetical protein AYO20_09171 [Fonsecaea nubica]OAL29434.1 hypothetical protein AYO20_09171 [Fonsecaea nubica]
MKFTAATAAAFLVLTLGQVGALPSPQANDGSVTGIQDPPVDIPIYYVEEADVEKRDSQGQHYGQHGGKPKGHGEHKWKGMGQGKGKGQHGPMPDDDDSVDLTPLLDHPDPEVQELGRRAVKATKFHWWEQQGNSGKFMNVVVGNPNVRPLANVKEQDLLPKEFKKRDPAAPAGANGDSDSQHAKGKWMGNEHDAGEGKPPQGVGGNEQWKQWRQNRGHGPMADDEQEEQ